jgi:hypothetical protein
MFPCYAASMINYSAIAHDHHIFSKHFLVCRGKKTGHHTTGSAQGSASPVVRSMARTQQFDKCFDMLFTFLGSSGTCLGGLWRSPGAGFPYVLYKCNFLNMLINCLLCVAYYVAYSATGKSEVQFELAGPNSCYGWALVG